MRGLIKIEFFKIVKRKDLLLLISMIFIPIIYSIGLAVHAKSFTYAGDHKVSGLLFVSEMYTFVYMCFLYFIVLSVCAVRSLKGEIENKSIQLYTQRVNNRRNVFYAKSAAYHILIFSSACVFIAASLACFYLFMVQREDVAVLDFCRQGEFIDCMIDMLSVFLCFIFTLNVSMFLGAYRKSYEAMGLFIFLWLAFMYLKEISNIQYFVPIYYVEKIVNADVGKCDKQSFVILAVLVFVYSAVFQLLGCRKFVKSDL